MCKISVEVVIAFYSYRVLFLHFSAWAKECYNVITSFSIEVRL